MSRTILIYVNRDRGVGEGKSREACHLPLLFTANSMRISEHGARGIYSYQTLQRCQNCSQINRISELLVFKIDAKIAGARISEVLVLKISRGWMPLDLSWIARGFDRSFTHGATDHFKLPAHYNNMYLVRLFNL